MFRVFRPKQKRKSPARPVLIGQDTVILEGKTISFTLKRSFRAKLIWLTFKPESGLQVTVPQRYSLSELPDFLRHNSSWILRHQVCQHVHSDLPPAVRKPLDSIFYLGKTVPIVRKVGLRGSIAFSAASNELVVTQKSDSDNLEEAVYLWMKAQAHKLITEKVTDWSAKLKVEFKRITIRNQKSRWGSCSHLLNLSFNWRLIMVPEEVLDYVVIHELCHLKEMNHKKVFWKTVAGYCPRWREHRTWLNHHRLELHSQISI